MCARLVLDTSQNFHRFPLTREWISNSALYLKTFSLVSQCLFFFFFFGLYPRHMEVPRPYTSMQCWIINPLFQAGDRTHAAAETMPDLYVTVGTPGLPISLSFITLYSKPPTPSILCSGHRCLVSLKTLFHPDLCALQILFFGPRIPSHAFLCLGNLFRL